MKEIRLESQITAFEWDELTAEAQELIRQARNAAHTAYAPYSSFCVGAAVRLANGAVVCGSNQENAAFPSGLCAERTALFYAAAHYPGVAITDIALAAYSQGKPLEHPVSPCGACRQVILGMEERSGQEMNIWLYGTENIYKIKGVKTILPLQFTTESMNQ